MSDILMVSYIFPVMFMLWFACAISTLFIKPFQLAKRNATANTNSPTQTDKTKHIAVLRIIDGVLKIALSVVSMLILIALLQHFGATATGKVISTFFSLVGFLQLFIVCVYYFSQVVVYYIFGKGGSDGYLLETSETSIIFSGLCYTVVALILTNEEIRLNLSLFSQEVATPLSDILISLFLVCWYFSAIFFSCSLFFILVNDLMSFLYKRFNGSNKWQQTFRPQKSEIFRYSSAALDNIEIWYDKTHKLKWTLLLKWLIIIPIDTLIAVLLTLRNILYELCAIIYFTVQYFFRLIFSWAVQELKNKLNKIIFMAAQIASILSFIITYTIICYFNLLSSEGQEVFSFISSVIIIPLILARVLDTQTDTKK